MNRFWSMICAVVVALSLGLIGLAWAENADQASSQVTTDQPLYQPTYQPVPGPSQGFLGYKPIPESALEGAIAVTTVPQPALRPAYPQQNVAGQSGVTPGSQLPQVYVTGIVGDGPYTLGRDDVIQISVRNQPEFSGQFAIGFDGRIQYNYLGDIPIGGMTKYEVQQVLEKMLSKYIRVPVVNVQIVAYNSKVVYIIGAISRPGKYVMRGDVIKLREAILAAGLPTPQAAVNRVHVIKPDLNNPDVRVVNMKPILYKGQLKDDVDLYAGELIVVPSTIWSRVNLFLSSILFSKKEF